MTNETNETNSPRDLRTTRTNKALDHLLAFSIGAALACILVAELSK